jgi:hypothetical protein
MTARAVLDRYYADHTLVEYHEAAHALTAVRLGWQLKAVRVGYARDSGETRMARPYFDAYERLCVLVAGGLGERSAPSWDDRLANMSAGDDERGIRDALAELGWSDAAPAEEEVDGLLLDNRRGLHRLARALRDQPRMDGARVVELLG